MADTLHLQRNSDELISDDVKEIISYRPHWMIRKGNMLFFIVLAFLLLLTWFIKYPDIITGSARLMALNAPKLINAKVEGKLVKLFVANEQQVSKGQHLGYMESTALYRQVMKLRSWIDETIIATANNTYHVLISHPLPELTDLGELQNPYQGFQNELLQTKQILASGYYTKRKAALQKDVRYLAGLKNNAVQQQQLLEQDQQLQKEELNAYESLAKEKVIAPLELNQYRSKLIAKQQSLKGAESQLTNSDIASLGKQKELLDLGKTVLDQQQKFHSALLDLKSAVQKWIQQYVLVASEEGKVLFISSLQEAEWIGAGRLYFT